VGASLEEAKAGHSRADFIAKCEISLKEARETHYWLRLIAETHIVDRDRLNPLLNACDEIVRVLTAIVLAARGRRS
jgi:four helix bundle protein